MWIAEEEPQTSMADVFSTKDLKINQEVSLKINDVKRRQREEIEAQIEAERLL